MDAAGCKAGEASRGRRARRNLPLHTGQPPLAGRTPVARLSGMAVAAYSPGHRLCAPAGNRQGCRLHLLAMAGISCRRAATILPPARPAIGKGPDAPVLTLLLSFPGHTTGKGCPTPERKPVQTMMVPHSTEPMATELPGIRQAPVPWPAGRTARIAHRAGTARGDLSLSPAMLAPAMLAPAMPVHPVRWPVSGPGPGPGVAAVVPGLSWRPAAPDNRADPQMRQLTTRALPQEGCAAFPCPEADCPDRFATQARLLRHLRSVHQQKKPLVCPYEGCGKRFAANHRLLVHTPVHSREKPYSCPWEGCDKRFSQSSNRKAHYQLHSGERPFACPHEACHKRFVQRAHLTCHLRAHSGKKTFVCPEAGCHKRFTQATNMTNHLRRHTHPFRSFRFVCHHEGCGRRLPTRYCLEVHLRVHSREKPFVCAYQDCNSRFSQYNNLVSHHRLHSGEKPYACPYENCDKAFRQPHHLKKHLGTHTKKAATDGQQSPEKQGVWASRSGPVLAGPPAAADDRPEDPLRQATTDTLPPGAGPMLPEQAPVHSGERPFACPEASCLSRFATQGRMLRHLRAVHRHQKPFACPDENCDKHFMQQVHLQSHLRTHTKDPVTTDRLPDDDSRSQPLGRHARKGTARRTAVPCQQELQGTAAEPVARPARNRRQHTAGVPDVSRPTPERKTRQRVHGRQARAASDRAPGTAQPPLAACPAVNRLPQLAGTPDSPRKSGAIPAGS